MHIHEFQQSDWPCNEPEYWGTLQSFILGSFITSIPTEVILVSCSATGLNPNMACNKKWTPTRHPRHQAAWKNSPRICLGCTLLPWHPRTWDQVQTVAEFHLPKLQHTTGTLVPLMRNSEGSNPFLIFHQWCTVSTGIYHNGYNWCRITSF